MTVSSPADRTGPPLPSVAVVIPCWNARDWVGRAIMSALRQTSPKPDVIVVDDGSTDDSLEIIKSFGQTVRWSTGPNRGPAAARNTGLALVSADYTLFLDADDYFEGPFIRSLATRAAEKPFDLAFAPSALEFPDGRRSSRPLFGETDTSFSLFPRVIENDWVPVHSIMWRTEFVRAIGGWNERMLRNDDGELLTRALLGQPCIGSSAAGSAIYVQHSNPIRVSLRAGSDALACEIEYLERRMREIENTAFSALGRPALARRAYSLAQWAFIRRHKVLGHRALDLSRRLGFSGHRGSRAHRLAARLMGLELKERLARLRWRLAKREKRASPRRAA